MFQRLANRRLAALAGVALASLTSTAALADSGQPQFAALDASNPNLAEWTLINLNATDVASASGGAGVKVALLDGVTDCRDTDLAGRCSYNLLSGGTYRYYSNHGTHTAGIIAGAKYGIATSATIVNYAVFDDVRFVATGTKLVTTWKNAYNAGARISSMSFGCTGLALCFSSTEVTAMADPKQPMLFVKAAGNDGVNLANEAIGVSATTAANALNRLLLVGSVDATGVISYFSNKPGDNCLLPGTATVCTEGLKWKNHFLVAPGEAIYSTLPGNTYGYMSGTSMATPVVSGAAALLQQRWPSLKNSPETLARILLTTATDLGAAGVDPVYGYGLLNVAKAFQANGSVTLLSTSGSGTTLTGSTTTSGGATLSRLASVLGGVTVYDQFGRDFPLAETGALKVTPNFMAMRQLLGRRLLGGGMSQWADQFFADEPQARGYSLVGSAADPAGGALNLDRTMRMGIDMPFKGGLAQLRLTGAGDPRQDFARDATMRPLAQFASTGLLRGAMIGSVTAILPGRTRIMAYGIGASGAMDPQLGRDPLEMRATDYGYGPKAVLRSDASTVHRCGFGMGLWKQAGARTVLGFNASMVRQGEGYYSLTSNLPFFQQPSRMYNIGAAGFRKAGEWEFSLSGEMTHLRTGGSSTQMLAFSPATMVSGELGLRKNHLTAKGRNGLSDSLALSLAVPPRAIAGNLRVDYLTPTADGMALMPTSLVVPLSRLGQEPVRLEGAYHLARAGKWSLDLTGGVNMARVEGLSPVEGMVALRLPLR